MSPSEQMTSPGARGDRAAGSIAAVRARVDFRAAWSWFGTWAFPFALILYLALSGGGYDGVVRGEVGVLVWWFLLLGAAAGALPARGVTRATVIGVALFAAFTAWTATGLLWTENAESTLFEVGRVATLLGILVLTVSLQDRRGLRRTSGAIATAIGVVGALAVLSRIHPSWFPETDTAAVLPSVANRLAYPLNYWNGLGALMATGAPLLLTQAVVARSVILRSLAAAAVPVLALATFLTLSRGGAIAFVLGIAALVVLSPRRLALVPTLGIAGFGSGLLIIAANQRDAFVDALTNSAAGSQGDEMLAMTIVVAVGVGLLCGAASLAVEGGMLRAPSVSRRSVAAGAAALVAVVLIGFFAAGGPGFVSDEWEKFKVPQAELASPNDASASTARFTSANGTDRYQFWSAAVEAGKTAPLIGIGPGQYESWWAEHGSEPTFVRDAHSLYFEVFAELGLIGVLLIVAALTAPLVVMLRALRRRSVGYQRLVAGTGASMIVFIVAAGYDWAWELTVLPAAFMVLAASILALRSPAEPRRATTSDPAGIWGRVGLAFTAVALLAVVAVPLASLKSVRASQEAARNGDLETALERALDAEALLPALASPHLQEALILEEGGELDPAAAAASEAVDRARTNWRTWLTLARIEAERGNTKAALDAFREAKTRNPRSALFAMPATTEEATENG